jgi:hypothetical protein
MPSKVKLISIAPVYGFYILLIIFDVIYIRSKQFGLIDGYLWIIADISLLAAGVYSLIVALKNTISGKLFFTTITLAAFIALLILNVPAGTSLSGETTQEISCALDILADKSVQNGFHQSCFLGYPARQYLMMVWPTFILGRSLIALNLGGCLYFIIGISIFCAGITKYLKPVKHRDLIIAITLAALFNFRLFNHFMFYFEQSIFPLSIGFAMVGVLFWYRVRYSILPLLISVPILIHTTYIYTPAIALVGLAAVVMIYLLFLKNIPVMHKFLLVLNLLIVIISLMISLSYRADVRLNSANQSTAKIISQMQAAVLNIFSPPDINNAYITPVFVFPFLILLLTMAVGVWGWQISAISIWIIAALVFAVIFQGYAEYIVSFKLHRAMVLIPILLGCLVEILSRYGNILRYRLWLCAFFSVFVFGIYNVNWILSKKTVNPHYPVISAINLIKDDKIQPPIQNIGFIDEKDDGVMVSLTDTAKYFLPGYSIVFLKQDEAIPECRLNRKLNWYLIINSAHPCFDSINIQISEGSNHKYSKFTLGELTYLVYRL